MQLVITGGAGFLGARLARCLLERGSLALAGAPPAAISRLILVDRAAAPPDLAADARVQSVVGDLDTLLMPEGGSTPAVPPGTACVFHLAAAVSGECEADFDLGLRSNIDATRALLQACRQLETAPVLVFASSLAVFGHSPEQPLPDVITDTTLPTPQTSYGIQKFIGEQLVADYTRKGFVRGRSVRPMTVSVRPGRPNGAASGFLSGMLREPLAGLKAACPVDPDTTVALASPGRTIEGFVRAAEASAADWGARTAINLPGLQTTPRQMAAALQRIAGQAATDLIDWTPDPAVRRIVATWPGNVRADRARGLGLAPDADFDAILADYVRENPDAAPLAQRR